MGRIPEKNSRFRTKDQICEDVAFVLNAPLTWGTQHAVLAEALWVWSEFDGKYNGCRNWSESAWAARATTRGLRHDHAVPKAILVADLKQLVGIANTDNVRAILENYCVGVVITKDEDNVLTQSGLRSVLPEGSAKDPWSRYRAAGIAIRHCPNDRSNKPLPPTG